ncbi:MAG: hypothetical protein JWM07_698 [Candidatus Saccharibacteria bacterium]|jgi:hypothetical protein|nr:hypothetical protein [Candidatus Saccharibacteria bacterium]
MSINKFTNDLDDASLHSNGFADVSRPINPIGASVSPQSFNQRLHIERNRKSVGGYHHSMLANGHHRTLHFQRDAGIPVPTRPGLSSEQPVDPRTNTGMPARRTGPLISDVVKPTMRPSFREPPTRGFNPYK